MIILKYFEIFRLDLQTTNLKIVLVVFSRNDCYFVCLLFTTAEENPFSPLNIK